MSGRKGEGKGKEGVFLFAICHRDIIEIRDLIVDEWAKESHGNLASSGELRSFRNEALVYYSIVEFTKEF